ncbi:MAG: M28 family peptidase [Ignavibacteriales bacterium]|nr:M28 family peptidase [Ignavibacteriales bacterium]
MKNFLTILLIIFSISDQASAQPRRDLLDPKLRDLFHEALSGELAKEHVIAITRHHRIQGSRGYRDAAHYVLGKLREYGFSEKDAYIESFKSDGKVQYQTWQSPSGWDITSAELRMAEPYDERIVGYPEIAMSVMTYSNAGDVTAELVWVGAGTSDDDYKGKDVKGKFVLATGYGGEVHRLAVLKYGAKAIVCYLDDDRAKFYPDMLQYTGMWPRTEELPKVTFGFNLTNRQGEKLKNMLLAGKNVVLHGWVKGIGLEPYFMDVVVAHIRGTEKPDEELVFSAHLDHPKESANDNASGSGAILDIARTLKELIDNGHIPKPKRSLRFLWVPEWNGTTAYIDKHVTPYSGGSDHMMFIDRKIPGIMFSHDPDYTHHTSEDTPGKVDPVELERCEMIATGTMWYLANLDWFEVRRLAKLVYTNASKALSDAFFRGDQEYVRKADSTWGMRDAPGFDNLLRQSLLFARHRLRSITPFIVVGMPDLEDAGRTISNSISEMETWLEQQFAWYVKEDRLIAESADYWTELDLRIPLRLTRGPLDFRLPESKLDSVSASWYHSKEFTLDGDMRFELVNFIDGKQTVSEIRNALSAEFHPVELNVVKRYIDDLAKVGVIKFN